MAVYERDLAAGYVAGLFCFLAIMLHTIETKLNKLLDAHGIVVTQREIDQE